MTTKPTPAKKAAAAPAKRATSAKTAKTAARRPAATKPAERRSPGRPTSYSPEIARRICEGLLEGKSLRSVCAEPDMPGLSTVMRWLHDDVDNGTFREQYARAREWAEELSQDECLEIARNIAKRPIGWVIDQRGQKVPVLLAYDKTAVAQARLEIATRQHLSAQRSPRRWGQLTGTGVGANTSALVVVKDFTGRKGDQPEPSGQDQLLGDAAQ